MRSTKISLDRPCTTEGPRLEERPEGRFCRHCEEMQYDLRDATRLEVIALARSRGGRVCGQLRVGPAGEPKFKPEPPPRTLEVLRSAAVAMVLSACASPSEETTVAPEPTTTAPVVAPPASVAEAPPTVAPPPRDEIDHSTDTSTSAADHQDHGHTHPPVAVDSDPTGAAAIGVTGHPEYRGGISVSSFDDDDLRPAR
jgi:hypothetical protein